MNRITTSLGDYESIKREQRLNFFELEKDFFDDFSAREKRFICDNIFTFECFFATDPESAMRSFCFPENREVSQKQTEWNAEIHKTIEKFSKIPYTYYRQREKFLENFYKKILLLSDQKPSDSMQYRAQMQNVVAKFLGDLEGENI